LGYEYNSRPVLRSIAPDRFARSLKNTSLPVSDPR